MDPSERGAPGAYRRGNLLVLPREGGTLPPWCVLCGEAAAARERRRISWLPAWILVPVAILVVVPACFIVAVIPALLASRRATVELPVCEAHRGAYRSWWARTVALSTLGPALAAIGLYAGGKASGPAVVAGALLFLGALVVGWRGTRHVWPKKISRRHVLLANVSPLLLDRLPPDPERP